MVFCCILRYFVAESVFCEIRCFVAKYVSSQFTRFCVEKNLAQNCIRGEKMTNMRYGVYIFSLRQTPPPFVCGGLEENVQ